MGCEMAFLITLKELKRGNLINAMQHVDEEEAINKVSSVEATIHHYKWEVKYEFKSPDCYKKLAITINGITPGPEIRAQQGDTIVVELKNSLLTENTAVHWHGIRQHGTPWSDGTAGVTQCPILPGGTFIYKFVVDKAGTYLYESHYERQRQAGLSGFIIVSPPDGVSEPFAYDHDRSILLSDCYHSSPNEQTTGQSSILLSDCYHSSPNEQTTGQSSIPSVFVGEPQSLIINGRGRYNCSLLSTSGSQPGVCNGTNPECSPFVLTVVPGKTYRLRIGSLTSLSALSYEIEGHSMTVVEADGNYVEPVVTRNLHIYSGETYSVLVKADQNHTSRNYWITANVVARKPATPTGLAIFNYYPNHPNKYPTTVPTTGPLWNDTTSRLNQSLALKAREGFINTPPLTSDQVIVLLNTQNKIDGSFRWSLNNVSSTLPATPYLLARSEKTNALDQSQTPDAYNFINYCVYNFPKNGNAASSNCTHKIKFNTTVDVILQNADSKTHPWHLHGHDFWVLGYGIGMYNTSKDQKKYNLVNPIMKNTVPVHPYGWTALRFRADNPGVWIFHSLIDFDMGMAVVFEEGIEKVGDLPPSIMGCGETEGYHRP